MTTKLRFPRIFRNPIGCLILLAALGAAAGCSTANTPGGDVVVNHLDASGNSIPGWLTPTGGTHAKSATLNYIANGGTSSCTECHGSDLTGGIARVSCFANTAGCHHDPIPNWSTPAVHGATAKLAPGSSGFAACQICHGNDFSGGGADVSCFTCHGVSAPHAPKPWRTSAGTTFTHTNTDPKNAPVCAQCHFLGSPNNPAGHPSTPAPAGTAPGCFNNTLCHGANPASHPVPFNDNAHYDVAAATFDASCGTCHDVSGPSTKVGPACQTCHVAASPLTAAGCTSCHAVPPDGGAPAGDLYPNIAGAHSAHFALTAVGTPISCDTCHNGLGTGTLNHYIRAKSRVAPGDVLFSATYNAKSGASSFDNGTALGCSNVSCHGGQTTPNWRTGAIDVNFQCESCHVSGTTQYNSYNSGQHAFHLAEFGGANATSCKFCHNTTALAVDHFTTLADNTISPAVASATVGGTGTLITAWTPGSGTSGTCDAACHPGPRPW